jgi:hypothetical protein
MSLFNLKEPMTVDELVGKLLSIEDLRTTSEQQNQDEIAMYIQGKKRIQFRQHRSSANEHSSDKAETEKKFHYKCFKYKSSARSKILLSKSRNCLTVI